jgi:hypothetical protein
MTLDITALRALLAAATPGKWHAQRHDGCTAIYNGYTPIIADHIASLNYKRNPRDEENAALICAAVNALPELLDEVARLRAVESGFIDTIESCPPSGRQLMEVYEIARRIVDEGVCRQMSCLVCKEILKLERILDAVDAARKERT